MCHNVFKQGGGGKGRSMLHIYCSSHLIIPQSINRQNGNCNTWHKVSGWSWIFFFQMVLCTGCRYSILDM